ncbi:MAG TPA: HPF/RaiA family ribosome-associated protein [Vicinamibacterales bacterium]|jgi:ribosomal subunit interface protein
MQVNVKSRALPVTEQTRAYLEYRFFCDLVPHSEEVVRIDVQFAASGTAGHEIVHCRALATLASGETIEALAAGTHLYSAIDRTAQQLGVLVAAQSRDVRTRSRVLGDVMVR